MLQPSKTAESETGDMKELKNILVSEPYTKHLASFRHVNLNDSAYFDEHLIKKNMTCM